MTYFLLWGLICALVPRMTFAETSGVNTGPFYTYGTGVFCPPVDDGSCEVTRLQQTFIYFGNIYRQIYVNNNGHLTFDEPWGSYTPYQFPAYSQRNLIAPFWTDLDNRRNGNISHQQYTNGSVVKQATEDINQYFPNLFFLAEWVFVATWDKVEYFPFSGTETTFQAVLISGGNLSFILFNYGPIAPGFAPKQAGYDTIGSDHYFVIHTSSSNLINQSSNVNVSGRWAFRVDMGSKGCTFNGSSVQLGDTFWSDKTCNTRCWCMAGGLTCQSQPCSFSQICRPAAFQYSCQTVPRTTCTVAGDPHYYTFDGSVFHFQGTCTYVLSEQSGGGLPYYRVEGKNENRGSTRVSWTRLVKVFVYGESIELVKGERAKAKINGTFVSTPFSLSNGNVQVYQSGFSIAVSTDFGLFVTYDASHYVRISLPGDYQNATSGLCGDFNNRQQDDFRTREGKVVSSDVEFANSWKGKGDQDPGCDIGCGGLSCAACTQEQTSVYQNTSYCGILQDPSGPFAPCHQQLPPQTYVDSCMYDLCVGEGYLPILCQSLNVYSTQCQQLGIQPINWRRQGFCEIPCQANSHFEAMGTGCPATCTHFIAPEVCSIPMQESCICNSNYVLSAGLCVPFAQCGCTFEGRYYNSGQTVILDQDCSRRCTCDSGSMSCSTYGCGPQEVCRVEDGELGCQPISYATCWIEGSRSYRTFDGLVFQYPGACTLNLVRVMGRSPYPHFTVAAEKVPSGQKDFGRVLKFEAEGTQVSIEMGKSSLVQVDGKEVLLPFSTESNRIRIYHSSIYSIVLVTSFGVTVQTDWPHFVRVTAPGIYNGSLGGLCGNHNGNQNDEFITPNGFQVNSSQAFGDSWRDGSRSAHCIEKMDEWPTSTGKNTSQYYSNQSCGIMASSDGPFATCQSRFDPRERLELCVGDLTAAGGAEKVLCEAIRGYALLCQQNHISVGDWRNETDCEQTCPENSHYEVCGSSCPDSCPSLSFPFSCAAVCQEGCQCNDGFLFSADQCVKPTACGCHYNGQYRQAGKQFWDGVGCQILCTCDGMTGAVQCFQHVCSPQESCRVVEGEYGCHPNPHGSCSASGDPHYLTFDGQAFDFQGTCRYTLATSCNSTGELDPFQVEARNEAWLGLEVSVITEVFVAVMGNKIILSSHREGVVQVNGVTSNLPVLLNGGRVVVFANGFHTVISTYFGLGVRYDGRNTVYISVPSNYSGQTCGLCGNFNGNRSDDFITPHGVAVSSPSEFGNSWKVPGNLTCTDGCGASCSPCRNETAAREKCETIIDAEGPFSFCHGVVSPAPYFSDCVFDTCVSGSRSQEVLCRAIQTYARACQSANMRIYPWRQNSSCAIKCPANSHYELCGTDFERTCTSSVDGSFENACSEGCFCDPGYYRSGRQCVPVQSCGCQYDGLYFEVGEVFWVPDCTERCKCHSPNDFRCSAASCNPRQDCSIINGRTGCSATFSTCTVWGDPHYITFDGALAHFQGTCSYIVAQTCSSNSSDAFNFRVVATNNHRGSNSVSFVAVVDIWLRRGGEEAHIRIGQSKRVTVDGSEVSVPTFLGSLAGLVLDAGYVVINSSDLTVQFDGHSQLLITLGHSHYGSVCGMCGNLNGDPGDDKVLPNGTVALSDNVFGEGWKANESQPGCGATDMLEDGEDCPFREDFSVHCSIITNTSGPFSACHMHSDPQPYFISCVYDLCLYTPANGMLCSAVSAYEKTCSVLGVNITGWRSDLQCAESNPCDQLDCSDDEWCGEQHGVYGCFCHENHQRPNNYSYDSIMDCFNSSGTMSLSRCQLFEAGFSPTVLHLIDPACMGTLHNGRLEFHFDNDKNICGTVLKSNSTHFFYENVIQNDPDSKEDIISRHRSIKLRFCCEYPLDQFLSMPFSLNALESTVVKKLSTGHGSYRVRLIPYRDAGFLFPLSRDSVNVEVNQRVYIAVHTEGVDGRQLSVIIESCWASPVNDSNSPERWDLITTECPSPKDSTVQLYENGVSTTARYSFQMFTFHSSSHVYLHCQVHMCLLQNHNCGARCYPGYHWRGRRDLSYHDSVDISVGPIVVRGK